MKIDAYTIKARVLPFAILIIPLACFFITLSLINLDMIKKVPMYIISLLGFIISLFVRNNGKNIQDKLWKEWDGSPSTRYLRHRNNEYNKYNRKMCHDYFRKHIKGINIPTASEELRDPDSADKCYESCVAFLRTVSRDKKKYNLVYAENIEYGFFRNSLGIKKIGIIIAFLVLVTSSYMICKNFGVIDSLNIMVLPLIISLLSMIFWLFFITKKNVKKSAECYAERLFEICIQNTD